MRPLSRTPLATTLLPAVALALAVVACGEDGPATYGFGKRSAGDTNTGGSSGAGGSGSSSGPGAASGSGGASGGSSSGTSSGDAGAWTPPPPPQTPQAGGFQQTIAPLLDANGCTECHHHGRPIDLTTYPFMAGDPTAAANQLVGAFTSNMPPAPRTAVPQSVIDQVNAWIAAGMKP
ncbi:MAG: hypothetical protein ABSE49_14725 [Polyangiaceae bacterium]|jgi:hypothetical protein